MASPDPYRDDDVALGTYDHDLMRWLLGYARPYWRSLVGCIVLLLALTGLQLAQPAIIARAIDRVMTPAIKADAALRPAYMARLTPLVWLYLGTIVASGAIGYGQALWLRTTGQRIIARLRRDVFDHVQTLSLSFYDRNPVGRLVTRATNDVEALNEMYTSVLVDLFRDLFVIVGALGFMLALDWRTALVGVGFMPLVAITSYIFRRYSRATWRALRAKLARINATLAESFSGMRIIQIFGREQRSGDEFRAINTDYYATARRLINIFAVFTPTLALLTTLALALVVLIGGNLVLGGAMTFGVFYAFQAYLRRLFDPINGLAEKYNILQSALASAERLSQLMATEPDVRDPETPSPALAALAAAAAPSTNGYKAPRIGRPGAPAVAFDDVVFRYKEGEPVLRGVSFEVMPGETVAFVGHTGAGKSTIMGLVPRFYDVQEGAVRVHGIDVRDWPQTVLRAHVGSVMQDVFLFAGDVADNIALGHEGIDRAAVERAAEIVGADAFIRRLPSGYDEPVVERGMTLSAGQRQLISFARAMAYDPEILILDEATASIDSETEEALQHAMQVVARGRTTIIVAHRLSTIQDVDRIHVMHKGRIVEVGRHAELLAAGGLYRRLWELQFEASRG
ncbi:MAG: ABC transporter ATP-binding protein [Anaerolineae bacterium]